jgi:hypothetical protein
MLAIMRVSPDGSFTQSALPLTVPADIDREWLAEVKYEWGDSYRENFALSYDGAEVMGTVSLLDRRKSSIDIPDCHCNFS